MESKQRRCDPFILPAVWSPTSNNRHISGSKAASVIGCLSPEWHPHSLVNWAVLGSSVCPSGVPPAESSRSDLQSTHPSAAGEPSWGRDRKEIDWWIRCQLDPTCHFFLVHLITILQVWAHRVPCALSSSSLRQLLLSETACWWSKPPWESWGQVSLFH